jgi:hypothetical protein
MNLTDRVSERLLHPVVALIERSRVEFQHLRNLDGRAEVLKYPFEVGGAVEEG